MNWEFTKIGHHCNYAIASEHLLTFRAGTAGFYDLENGGTSHLEGFRSGCRNSLIPANGVLNAPNFANGCTCSYAIFTSLAFVHVPENRERVDLSAPRAAAAAGFSIALARIIHECSIPADRRASQSSKQRCSLLTSP